MSFFDRRKNGERRSVGNNPVNNTSERRNGTNRRAGSDRRMDRYHQMELSRRRVICQIIELLERDADR